MGCTSLKVISQGVGVRVRGTEVLVRVGSIGVLVGVEVTLDVLVPVGVGVALPQGAAGLDEISFVPDVV